MDRASGGVAAGGLRQAVRSARVPRALAALKVSRALLLLPLFVLAQAVFAAPAAPAEPPANRALAALFEREFRLQLQEHPESATYVGAEGLNDRLTDRSPAAVARRKRHVG
jgi:hypothetical protein